MKNLQKKVLDFVRKYNLEYSPETSTLDMVSEIGELAKEILKYTDYGKAPSKIPEETKTEIGDVFYSLIALANSLNIDLEEALELVLKKYEKRIKEKGSTESGR